MLKAASKTIIVASAVAISLFAAKVCLAHPEMDAWGRDITSGPLPPIVAPATPATGEIAGSIIKAETCNITNEKNCRITTEPKKVHAH